MNLPADISGSLKKVVLQNDRRFISEMREWFFAPVSLQKPNRWNEQAVILDTPFSKKQSVDFTGREYWRDPIDDIDDPEVIYQTKCMGTGAGKTTIDML